MNERTVKTKIIKGLEARMPGCVIYAHADIGTSGIPDLSISYNKKTIWLEIKNFPAPGPPLSLIKKKFDALQLAQLLRLAARAHAFYAVSFSDNGLMIMRPSDVQAVRNGGQWLWLHYEELNSTLSWITERIMT